MVIISVGKWFGCDPFVTGGVQNVHISYLMVICAISTDNDKIACFDMQQLLAQLMLLAWGK